MRSLLLLWALTTALTAAVQAADELERRSATDLLKAAQEKIVKLEWSDALDLAKRAEETARAGGDNENQAWAVLDRARVLELSLGDSETGSLKHTQSFEEEAKAYRTVMTIGNIVQKRIAFNNLGVLQLQQKNFADAVSLFREAAALFAESAAAAPPREDASMFEYNFGRALELAEQPEEACGHYLRALEINIRMKPAAEGAFRVLARLERPDAAATLARRLIENGQYSVPVTELHRLLTRWGGGEHGPTVLTELLRYYAAASVDPPEFQRREFLGEEEPETPQHSANGTPTEAEHWIGLQALAEKFSGLRPPIASLEKAFLSPIDLVFEQNEAATIFPEPLGGDWKDLFLALLKRIGAYYGRTGDPLKALPRFTAVWALDHSNVQAALSAAGLLQDNRKKIDPQGKILDRFIESIFEEKTFAYRTNSQDWENILRFHIVLGTIYADQKQWGHDENSDARTAMFQFSHALRAEEKIHERKPDSPPSPGLYERLGECYQAIGIEREALDSYLRAAEIFAKNGSAAESKMAFEKAAGLSPNVVRIEQTRFDIVKAAVTAIQPPIIPQPEAGFQALSIAKRSIGPGESITGEVRLSAPASQDLAVGLSTDSPEVVSVPSSVRIGRGESGASFSVVGSSSKIASAEKRVVRIKGRLAGVERSIELLILGRRAALPNNPTEILQFNATPSTIGAGEQAVLTFRLANAQAARIEPEVGALTSLVSGTVPVSPQTSTEYTLLVTGPEGTTASKTVSISVRPNPPVSVFQALSLVRGSIGPGESVAGEVRLSAPASQDLAVSLSTDLPEVVSVPSSVRIGRGESGASFSVVGSSSRIASAENRVVRITGRLAGVERSIKLLILGRRTALPNNPTVILQFSATPSTIRAGEQAVLTFRLANAQAARIEPEVGALTSLVSGTVRVSPQRPTRYFLVATGSNGSTTRQVAFVNVRPSPHPSPPDGQKATPSNSGGKPDHHTPTPKHMPFGTPIH